LWNGGQSRSITWDVSGTNANGINVANVKISLSTDGGLTFPTVLAASTANDGSESITVPAVDTLQARIKIEAIGNIFFDINDANFRIDAVPATSGVISGRITNAKGIGIARTTVVLSGGGLSTPLKVQTNSFGYYSFPNIAYNQTYTITPQNKKYTFAPLSIVRSHTSDATDLNFTTVD
jgi:hypothetical protein